MKRMTVSFSTRLIFKRSDDSDSSMMTSVLLLPRRRRPGPIGRLLLDDEDVVACP